MRQREAEGEEHLIYTLLQRPSSCGFGLYAVRASGVVFVWDDHADRTENDEDGMQAQRGIPK